ncbi:MAG: phosphatidate cytidylyltransferase [Alphaproteobacteria bacterium]|nr:phosphatidate cytidylyltransferase [Alphaproteobacteria bacterium]
MGTDGSQAGKAGEAARGRWTDLRERVLSAIVLAPIALLAIWVGQIPFSIAIGVMAAVLAWEWVHLCGLQVRRWPGMAVAIAVVASAGLAALGWTASAYGLLGVGGVITWLLARERRHPRAAWLGAGVLYVGLAALSLIWLRDDPRAGLTNLLFIVLLVWASDIGAYAVGRIVGGPRLWPAVSPGKTWSGAVGGLVAAIAVGIVAARFIGQAPGLRTVLVAAALGIVAQLGDLLESAIKRHFKVKDSSHLIPGHGGLFDRVDALLAVAPAAALIEFARGPGAYLWE